MRLFRISRCLLLVALAALSLAACSRRQAAYYAPPPQAVGGPYVRGAAYAAQGWLPSPTFSAPAIA